MKKDLHITVHDAAKYLGYSDQYVRRLIAEKKLRANKVGASWILYSQDVQDFILAQDNHTISDCPRTKPDLPNSKLKALSFFSGAMGMDLGLEAVGIQTLLACEIDKASRETIRTNRPNVALIGDLNDYSSQQILEAANVLAEDVDLMVGGPPCQAFSSAGKRQSFKDLRGNVFLTFIDRILEIRPKYVVIENVRGLLSAPLSHTPHDKRRKEYGEAFEEVRGSALYHIIERLRSAGYGVSFNLYNAANYGAPQKRERVVIICCRQGRELPYLCPTHSALDEDSLKPWNNLRETLAGLREAKQDHVNFPEKRLKYYKLLKAGQNWRNLPVPLQMEALGKSYFSGGGKTGFLRRLSWDNPAPTLVTHPAMPATDLCHPEKLRPLSVQEYKRIQEFPDDWKIMGSRLDQYKQIGNAVPVSLGQAIGKLILDAEKNKFNHPPLGFKFSRYKNTAHKQWEAEIRSKIEARDPVPSRIQIQAG